MDDSHFGYKQKNPSKKKKTCCSAPLAANFLSGIAASSSAMRVLVQYGPRAPCFRRIFKKDFVKFELGAHIFIINISFENGSGVCADFFGFERCSKFRAQTTTTNNQNHNNFVFFQGNVSKYLPRY
jgi:hypothetical protein